MPLPRRRNTCPVCVSGGTFTLAEPSSVGISISPPRAAVREADRHLAMQVVAVALEDRVLLEVDHDVEVARRAAVHAGLAFARQADAVALVDARRESSPRASCASSCGRRRGRWRRDRRSPCRCRGRWGRSAGSRRSPATGAPCPSRGRCRTSCGCVPGLAPEPWQVSHVSIVGMRILVSVPRAACSRRDLEVVAQVRAAEDRRARRAPWPAPKMSLKMSPKASAKPPKPAASPAPMPPICGFTPAWP